MVSNPESLTNNSTIDVSSFIHPLHTSSVKSLNQISELLNVKPKIAVR